VANLPWNHRRNVITTGRNVFRVGYDAPIFDVMTTTPSATVPASPVLEAAPAAPDAAAAYFSARLTFQADVTDVHASLDLSDPGFVLIDSRALPGWQQGHIPGAVHLPTGEIAARALAELDPAVPVVTYCWGPGCDGATRAALAFANLGFQVKEMIGGIEYWIREGFTVETLDGPVTEPIDGRVAPLSGIACAC
jgi:rhodanese-related sulfurtransferase